VLYKVPLHKCVYGADRTLWMDILYLVLDILFGTVITDDELRYDSNGSCIDSNLPSNEVLLLDVDVKEEEEGIIYIWRI